MPLTVKELRRNLRRAEKNAVVNLTILLPGDDSWTEPIDGPLTSVFIMPGYVRLQSQLSA